ncbi:WbqC-like protein family protein [Sporomusa ovata DSM 2662]|uniref:WbqC-like protein family protein n=1 Tax=Sporomusa ovata TaxID=2378 RepID=A0A0U1KVB6_9FIRM|nr:WbqC family protein [Sporomusa ovata]EQB27124.1 WbqC-like protein family [Sporomusa ovata DSM 2662]CQR71225.1 hypothetical protein SpAn4DRAFT_1627 [Sporomusa ovata]
MGKTVVILQSNYLPWKGYLDLIHDADIFVFYDDVQYTVNDWRNRNKIVANNRLMWLTVPVYSDIKKSIDEICIAGDKYNWQKKHWGTIVQFYGKAPFFAEYKEKFEEVYVKMEWDRLSDLNQYLIIMISRLLGIKTKFVNVRDLAISGGKTERLVNIVNHFNASTYISGPAAKDYLEEELFYSNNIELRYKEYAGYPQYPQFQQQFEHGVSIIDLLFHVGKDAPYYIWGWRSGNFS